MNDAAPGVTLFVPATRHASLNVPSLRKLTASAHIVPSGENVIPSGRPNELKVRSVPGPDAKFEMRTTEAPHWIVETKRSPLIGSVASAVGHGSAASTMRRVAPVSGSSSRRSPAWRTR